MSRLHSRARRAFTLVEILVAVTILGIIGAGLVRLILVQSRFTEKQMAGRNARTVARNAMNIMLTDLRMVQDNDGLVAASNDSVTVRVPIAFGLYCGGSTVSLMPVDSAMVALGQYGGWAIRDSTTGRYTYRDANTPVSLSSITPITSVVCSGAGITQVTSNGRTGSILSLPDSPSGGPTPGWPAFIYQTITYQFGASTSFPGRIGLLRKVKTGAATVNVDEIIAPFDTASKFRFYILNADTAQWAPPGSTPAELNTVRGIQLFLVGSSPVTPRSSGAAPSSALVTGVFFKNRRDP